MNKKHLGIGFFSAILLFFIYLFFFSKYFSLSNIEIQNTTYTDADKVETFVQNYLENEKSFLSQNNFFLLSKEKLSKAILDEFFIEQVKIKKHPFSEIIIAITERASRITWITGHEYYYLDDQGTAIESILVTNIAISEAPQPTTFEDGQITAPTSEPEILKDDSRLNKSLPQVIDEGETPVAIGDKVLTDSMVNFISLVHENITTRTGLEIINYRLTETSYTELKAVTNQNFFIYFESTHDLERQLENLALVVREKVATATQVIEYIDLRDENNTVYIK